MFRSQTDDDDCGNLYADQEAHGAGDPCDGIRLEGKLLSLMILREKPDLHRAIPVSGSSRRSSTALYDRLAAQLRHSLLTGEGEARGEKEMFIAAGDHPYSNSPPSKGERMGTEFGR